jgi:hypothetical protein
MTTLAEVEGSSWSGSWDQITDLVMDGDRSGNVKVSAAIRPCM